MAGTDGGQRCRHDVLDGLVEYGVGLEGEFHQAQFGNRASDLGGGERHLALADRQLRYAVVTHDRHRFADLLVGLHIEQFGNVGVSSIDDVGDDRAVGSQEAEAAHPVVVEDLGEVATTRVGREHDDEVVGGAFVGDLQRCSNRRAARTTDQQALLLADSASHREGVGVADRNDPIDQVGVIRRRPEVLTDAFDQVRAARATGVHRPLGIGADHLDRWVLLFQIAADTREGAAGAAAGDEVRDGAVGLSPDLRAGRLVMGQRVGRIEVLIRTVRPGDFVHESLGGGVVRLRIVGSDGDGADDDLGAVGPQQVDLLGGDLVGHDEDTLVPALGCHDREADTGVARCRFDDRAAGFEQAFALGVVDHADRRTILRRPTGVGHLGFDDDLAGLVLRHLFQVDQRRVADQVKDRVVNLHER